MKVKVELHKPIQVVRMVVREEYSRGELRRDYTIWAILQQNIAFYGTSDTPSCPRKCLKSSGNISDA